MDFLNEVAGEFVGRSELADNMLIVRFQDERLRFFTDNPVSIGIQYAANSATCRMFAYVRTDINASNDRVFELCNRLNSQAGNYARYYLNEEHDVMVELNYLAFDDDVFTHVITPGMVARIAKAVDDAVAAFYSLENA